MSRKQKIARNSKKNFITSVKKFSLKNMILQPLNLVAELSAYKIKINSIELKLIYVGTR